MANLVTKYSITDSAWTKIGTAVTGLYIQAQPPVKSTHYVARILKTGDAAPVDGDAINMDTDVILFVDNFLSDSIVTSQAADIYCRLQNGSGGVKVL